MSAAEGYRRTPRGGAQIRADVVDVYVFRRSPEGVEFLQLMRATEPLKGTWHPVMGHVEAGETSDACALRELGEELGLASGDGSLLGVWALEQVHPFYLRELDCIVMSPRFAAEVSHAWTARLNEEHSAARWVAAADAGARFVWPGQVAAAREIVEFLLGRAPEYGARLRVV